MTERNEYIKFSEDILSRQKEILLSSTFEPEFIVEDNYNNAWSSTLTQEEQDVLDEIVPSEFVLPQQFDAKTAAEALEKMTKAAEIQFEDYLKGKSVSEDEISEKLSEIPDFGANAFVKCADLRIRFPLNSEESPVKSFEKIGNSTEFVLTLNTQKLHEKDREELMNWRNLEERVRDEFLVRNLLDFDDFSNEKLKTFWDERVKKPIREHLEKVAQPEFSLKVHEHEFSLSEAVSNRIFEPAKEHFNEHKKELLTEEKDVPIGYFSLRFDLNTDYLKVFSPNTQEAIKNAFEQVSIEDGTRLVTSTHNAIDKINASITETSTKNGEKQAIDIEKLIKDYQITAHLANMKLVVAQKEQNGLRPEGHNPFCLDSETLTINQARFDKEKGGFVFQVKEICFLPDECRKIKDLFSETNQVRLEEKFRRLHPAFSQFDTRSLTLILEHEANDLDIQLRTDFTNPIELILPPNAETFTECLEHTYLKNCEKK